MNEHTDNKNILNANLKNGLICAVLSLENSVLSSKHTFFWKFVFMPVWIISYWPVVLVIAWNRLSWSGIGMLSVPWILGSIYLYLVYGKIMKVSFCDSRFIISNYRKEIMISLSDIESVGGSILLNPELVWLNLKENSEFGKRIIFAPEQRSTFSISTGFTRHPFVTKINNICADAEDK